MSVPRGALDDIIRICEKARQSGASYMACCPAHEDSSPSLHITPDGDQVLLHCFAGCEFEDIVKALEARGVKTRELREERRPYREQFRDRCPRCGLAKPKGWKTALCPVCFGGGA